MGVRLEKYSSKTRLTAIIAFVIFNCFYSNAQYYVQHYIAPAQWQYFSNANEIVIATSSSGTANISIEKSDGTFIVNLTATIGSPAVYRFSGSPGAALSYSLNSVISDAGLIITSNLPVSVNIRNVASDAGGASTEPPFIKGNAALFSFGDAGIGTSFRLGYYRNTGGVGTNVPFYSVMAIDDSTDVSLNGAFLLSLNAGESYIFSSNIGDLLTTNKGVVANSGKLVDVPGGCGDGVFDQIPPVAVLGNNYFVVRGAGNDIAEQSTIVATAPATTVIVSVYNALGTFVSSTSTFLNAGNSLTVLNGLSLTPGSAIRIESNQNVVVYSGSANGCEVDMAVLAPSGPCSGSTTVETYKFRGYVFDDLNYFGYVVLNSATNLVFVNGVNLETLSGTRRQLGTSGWFVIDFTAAQIGFPTVITLTSSSNITVALIQQGAGFSMSGFYSAFKVQPKKPDVNPNTCISDNPVLQAQSGLSSYQWYHNNVPILGATSSSFTPITYGVFHYSALLPCGEILQAIPITIENCLALPIELINFDARYNEGIVELVWNTSSEKNNAFFTIEKSIDGATWKTFEIIEGSGNSNFPISYATEDPQPEKIGTIYYRLRQTDFDGLSKIVAIRAVLIENTSLEVIPIPFNSLVTVSSNKMIGNFRLVNLLGQTVYTGTTNEKVIELDLGFLEKGFYFIETTHQTVRVYKN